METTLALFIQLFESTCDLEFGSREAWQQAVELQTAARFREYFKTRQELEGILKQVDWKDASQVHSARARFLRVIGIDYAKDELKAASMKPRSPEEAIKERIDQLSALEMEKKREALLFKKSDDKKAALHSLSQAKIYREEIDSLT